jgi:predicted acylesterase/phospholipase RssA
LPKNDTTTNTAHPIQRIVLSGGGAKSTAYVGAYTALIDTHVLSGVQEIAGSSAGAVTATLMSVGVSLSDFRDMFSEDFNQMLGKKVGKLYGNPEGVSYFTYDGGPFVQLLRRYLFKTLRDFFLSMGAVDLPEALCALKDRLSNFTNDSIQFTFRDLALLREHYPSRFKRLIITAADISHVPAKIVVFNERETPDVDISAACRASGSVPALFQRIEMQLNGHNLTLVDSGLLENCPTDFFDYDESGHRVTNKKRQNTLVFGFNGTDNAHAIDKAVMNRHIDFDEIFEKVQNEVIDDLIFCNEPISMFAEGRPATDEWFKFSTYDYQSEEKFNILSRMMYYLQSHFNALWERMSLDTDRNLLREIADVLNALFLRVKNAHILENESPPNVDIDINETNEVKRAAVIQLSGFLVKRLKEKFYTAGFWRSILLRLVLTTLADIPGAAQFPLLEQERYRYIQRVYRENLISLQVGDLRLTSFTDARERRDSISAHAYMDVMDAIGRRGLACDNFPHAELKEKSISIFEHVYKAILIGAGQDPDNDEFLSDLALLAYDNNRGQTLVDKRYNLIRSCNAHSTIGVASSIAVNYARRIITGDDLFKQAYIEGYARSSWFSISKISGKSVYLTSSLKSSLQGKRMFGLFREREAETLADTRTKNVYDALRQIEGFYT